MKKRESHVEGVADLFKVLSKPDALEILFLTNDGIENSTQTIEEMAISQKRYYTRLKALVEIGLVRKIDGVYGQTGLGRMVCDRFLPAMGKAVDAREDLDFLMGLERKELDNGARKRIMDKLEIPGFAESAKGIIYDYESMVIDVIDMLNNAEKSILMASNYLDARVMDAITRSWDRGVKHRAIIGSGVFSSKLKRLRLMLSPKVTMALMKIVSNSTDLSEIARIIDIPYSFCVVDGHHSILEIFDTLNEGFIVALSSEDQGVIEKLTKIFETLWKAGEIPSTLSFLNSFKA